MKIPNKKNINLFYRCFRFVLEDDLDKARELGWKKMIIMMLVAGTIFIGYLYFKFTIFFG